MSFQHFFLLDTINCVLRCVLIHTNNEVRRHIRKKLFFFLPNGNFASHFCVPGNCFCRKNSNSHRKLRSAKREFEPCIYNLKILGGGNFNIINQSGEPQKRGNQIFKVQWEVAKGGDTIFDLHLLGETLEETMGNYQKAFKKLTLYFFEPSLF